MRLVPAFDGHPMVFVTVQREYCDQTKQYPGAKFYTVFDVTRWNKVRWIQTVLKLLYILIRERPGVVVSTGALPGYFALRLGKLMGARTVWVDSIANVEELSKSGQMIGKHASLWLTQWEHLASEDGPAYRGAVI